MNSSGSGICTPRPRGYEPRELLLLHPAIEKLVAGAGSAHGLLCVMSAAIELLIISRNTKFLANTFIFTGTRYSLTHSWWYPFRWRCLFQSLLAAGLLKPYRFAITEIAIVAYSINFFNRYSSRIRITSSA